MKLTTSIDVPEIKCEIDTDSCDIAILYAPNGSGKSKLLQSLNSQDSSKLDLRLIPPERGGVPEYNRNRIEQEKDTKSSLQQRRKNQVNDYRQRAVTYIGIYADYFADSARSKAIKAKHGLIEKKLESIFPKYMFDVSASNGITVEIVINDSINNIDIKSALSTSESDVITVCLDIVCSSLIHEIVNDSEELLIMVDEPTAFMNVDTTASFAKFLVDLTREFNVKFLVSTNDHEFISAVDFYKVRQSIDVITIGDDGATNQKKLNISLSDNIVGGFITQGRFLGKKPLFVEGSDDQYIWQRAARVPGGPNVVAFDVGGGNKIKSSLKSVELLAQGSGSKQLLALGVCDGDININFDNQNKKFTRGYSLLCREIENIYLSDENLKLLGCDWNQLKIKIANEGTSKLHNLVSNAAFDRKNDDIKPFMDELVVLADPNEVDWKITVSKLLADFRNADLNDWFDKEFVDTLKDL